jgi:hypothetical protein
MDSSSAKPIKSTLIGPFFNWHPFSKGEK